MKVAIFVVLMSLCFLASAKEYEKIWGDVNKSELGREKVVKEKCGGEYQTYHTFTYPKVSQFLLKFTSKIKKRLRLKQKQRRH